MCSKDESCIPGARGCQLEFSSGPARTSRLMPPPALAVGFFGRHGAGANLGYLEPEDNAARLA
jgi:hypothetical protein